MAHETRQILGLVLGDRIEIKNITLRDLKLRYQLQLGSSKIPPSSNYKTKCHRS